MKTYYITLSTNNKSKLNSLISRYKTFVCYVQGHENVKSICGYKTVDIDGLINLCKEIKKTNVIIKNIRRDLTPIVDEIDIASLFVYVKMDNTFKNNFYKNYKKNLEFLSKKEKTLNQVCKN